MSHSKTKHSKTTAAGPRNWLGRREQMRLMFLVGLLMLTLIAMERAADPGTWAWMWAGVDDSAAPAGGAGQGGEIDTRVEPADNEPRPIDGQVFLPDLNEPVFQVRPELALDGEERAEAMVRKDVWETMFATLENRRREAREDLDRRDETLRYPHTWLLGKALAGTRGGDALSEDEQRHWADMVAQIDELFLKYVNQLNDQVQRSRELSDEDKATYLVIFHNLRKYWNDQLHYAFAAAAKPSTLTEVQQEELQQFAEFFDDWAYSQIKDGTTLTSASETPAWFRLFELLQALPEETLADKSIEQAGFAQLYEQPDSYRGKLVRVRGTAKRVRHTPAPSTAWGIDDYYIIDLLPAGGPTSPIVIYALDLPEDFPSFDAEANEKGKLDETVEVTGFFYKRFAYLAGDGSRQAPVMLARTPVWQPPPPKAAPPPWWWIVIGVAATALLAIGIAAFAYNSSNSLPQAEDLVPSLKKRGESRVQVDDSQLAPSPSEMLADLATQERSRAGEGEA